MTLAAKNITVHLGHSCILENLSLAVQPATLTVLLGPNGAGKTTLLTTLAGLQKPVAGHILLQNKDIAQMPMRDRAQQIGYLPQTGDVHWAISVRTVVELGRLPHRGVFGGLSKADHAAVDAALTLTETTTLATRRVTELSGGERARVLLARVLAGSPSWILADEPLTHLDPAHQLDVLHLLQQAAQRGVGVCVVLHDLSLAGRFADRLVLMQQGRVVADGAPDHVLTPENLAVVYQIQADIRNEGDGLSVTPLGRI
jgi:iron complex transport system ATP-binding protein